MNEPSLLLSLCWDWGYALFGLGLRDWDSESTDLPVWVGTARAQTCGLLELGQREHRPVDSESTDLQLAPAMALPEPNTHTLMGLSAPDTGTEIFTAA